MSSTDPNTSLLESAFPNISTRHLIDGGFGILILAWVYQAYQETFEHPVVELGFRCLIYLLCISPRFRRLSLGWIAIFCPPVPVFVRHGCSINFIANLWLLILGGFSPIVFFLGGPVGMIVGMICGPLGYFLALVHSWYSIAAEPSFILRRKGPRAMKADNIFFIKEIKAEKRDEGGTKMYLVSWEGFGADEDTWEYSGNISREAMKAYKDGLSATSRRRSSVSTAASTRRRSSSRKPSITRRRSSTPKLGVY